MEQNTNMKSWIAEEESNISKEVGSYEKLPGLKLVENEITEISIDFSKPFERYTMDDNGVKTVKAIIPCLVKGQRMVWWLNRKNPVYSELLKLGKNNQTIIVRVMRTGKAKDTKFVICK